MKEDNNLKKQDLSVNVVKETTDYAKFSYSPANRNTIKRNDLLDSIKKYGLICPIIVTKDLVVYDGQHRLEICEVLSLPVKYIVEQIPEELIIELNTTQRKWTPRMFLQYYIKKGNLNYATFNKLAEESGLSINALYAAIKGRELASEDMRAFKKGNLCVSSHELKKYNSFSSKLKDVLDSNAGRFKSKLSKSRTVAQLVNLINHPKYDHEMFLNRLNHMQQMETMIKSSGSYADAKSMLENAYNTSLPSNRRIIISK